MLLPLLPSFGAGGAASAPVGELHVQKVAGAPRSSASHRLVVEHTLRGSLQQVGSRAVSWLRARPRLTVRLRGRVQRRRLRALLRASHRSAGSLRLTRTRRPRRRANRLLRIRSARSWHNRRPAATQGSGTALRGGRVFSPAEAVPRGG